MQVWEAVAHRDGNVTRTRRELESSDRGPEVGLSHLDGRDHESIRIAAQRVSEKTEAVWCGVVCCVVLCGVCVVLPSYRVSLWFRYGTGCTAVPGGRRAFFDSACKRDERSASSGWGISSGEGIV